MWCRPHVCRQRTAGQVGENREGGPRRARHDKSGLQLQAALARRDAENGRLPSFACAVKGHAGRVCMPASQLALALRLYPCRALPISSTHVPGAPWWSKREPSKPCTACIAGDCRLELPGQASRGARGHMERRALPIAAAAMDGSPSAGCRLTVKCGSPQPWAAASGHRKEGQA